MLMSDIEAENSETTEGSAEANKRRQKHLKEAMRIALTSENGLFLLSAPTGAGKNHVAADVISDLMLEKLDAVREGRSCGRRYIVILIPGSANRTEYAAKIREMITEKSDGRVAPADAERLVVDLASLEDGFFRFIKPKIDAEGQCQCPLTLVSNGGPAEDKRFNRQWDDAVKAFQGLYGAPRENKPLVAELGKQAGMRESALRKAVGEYAKTGGKGGLVLSDASREIAREIWPAIDLVSPGPHAILATPQKALWPIDTVVSGRANMTTKEFARKAQYVVDEIDHAKSDILDTLADSGSVRYQPDELVRNAKSKICLPSRECNPAFRGNADAWRRVFAKTKGVFAADASDEAIAKKAAAIAESYENAVKTVESVYADLGLERAAKTSEEILSGSSRYKMLFATDDLTVKTKNGDYPHLRLEDDPENERASIVASDDGNLVLVETFLRRSKGAVRVVVSHISRVASLFDEAYRRRPGWSHDSSVRLAIDAMGFHNDETREINLWFDLVRANERKVSLREKGLTRDSTIFTKEIGYVELDDSEDHEFTTYLRTDSIPYYPELVLSTIAKEAPVLGMSATWNAPTIKNWCYEYLEEECGVVAHDEAFENLNERIKADTSAFNAACARRYSCKAEALAPDARLTSLVELNLERDSNPALRDQAMADAYSALIELGGALFAQKASSMFFGGRGPYSASSIGAFEFGRLLKRLAAVSRWARGVSDGTRFGGLILTQTNANPNSSNIADTIFAELAPLIISSEAAKGEGFFKGEENIAGALAITSASNWDQVWPKAKSRLESGRPTLVVTTRAHGGFSKNLQFRMPERLNGIAVELDFGYSSQGPREIDMDFIYLDNPTNILCSELKESSTSKDALKAVAEQEELAYRVEIDERKKVSNVNKLLKHSPRKVSVRTLDSCTAEAARTLDQAVGRLSRTNSKMPESLILVDSDALGRCDFTWLSDMPNCLEVDALVKLFSTEATDDDEKEDKLTRKLELKALRANRLAYEDHTSLLANVFSENPAPYSVAAFDRRRRTHAEEYAVSQKKLEADRHLRSFLVKAPVPAIGYAYAMERGDDPARIAGIEFMREGETSTRPAELRLRERVGGKKRIGSVSQENARFGEIVSVPCVAQRFKDLGFPTEPSSPGLYLPTVYGHVTQYLGFLGELAGSALFDEFCRPLDGTSWSLTRGEDDKAERGGDFEVLVDGEHTGVWIDFKHYRLGSYFSRAWEMDGLDAAKRFDEKAASVDAKLLIVCNVLADEAAMGLKPKALGERCACIPYLVKDGLPDWQMLGELERLVSDAVKL